MRTSKNTKNEELRELFVLAFMDAKARRKPNWRKMNLSVLKNRLLQRSERRFRESDFGGTTMQELVERFPDMLGFQDGCDPLVSFLGEIADENPEEGEAQFTNDSRDIDGLDDKSAEFQALLDQYRTSGDNFGVGEAYASQLSSVDDDEVEKVFVSIVAQWASSTPVHAEINTIGGLLGHVDKFVVDRFALAVVHATLRTEEANRKLPERIGDVNYRVAKPLQSLFSLPPKTSPTATMRAATAKTNELILALQLAVDSFCQSTAVAAKLPSTNVIMHAHAYAPFALFGERQTLRDVEVLLGALFRKFCESCEKYEAERIPRRANDLSRILQRTVDGLGRDSRHRIQRTVLEPVVAQMSRLIEEGTRTSDEMMRPSLQVVGGTFKLDLGSDYRDIVFPARVVNDGDGTAHGVGIRLENSADVAMLSASEPSTPFDLPPGTERLIRFKLSVTRSRAKLDLPAILECVTANGNRIEFKQRLKFEQQRTQPDWDALLRDPPYAINPIREKKNLYGRDSVLAEIELHVSNETSTFLWGQKRVGKTSVLQVLAAKLNERGDIACIVLRMGELASLHEGQIGHTIARRLVGVLQIEHEAPQEDEFRAGLGRLVPFVEELAHVAAHKMLIIIDEFDDLNPAFYLGERGKQFVKALRSLSEVGLTFMFVGSERMNSIYHSHSADLNKWINSSLDRIEVDADCEALIVEPVTGKIEYDPDAVKNIIEFCRGNPFYMHLVAGKLFQRCVQERRTFVGASDFDYVCRSLVRELGPTNFAHFWEDVPVLDPSDKHRSVALNCLFLACISTLGSGRYESLDDLVKAQGQLGLEPRERLTAQEFAEVESNLVRRRVVSRKNGGARGYKVDLPVFREWLLEHGEAELIPVWRSFQKERTAVEPGKATHSLTILEPSTFPIDEDELLAVSERLLYLGKQKDVAEVRRWLRQFDDDGRIEVAFLLLRRLAEKGFVNDGANVNGIAKMEEALDARRQDIGDGAWRIFRRRKDNLYLGHVDSETKSGAATARELAKRIGPSKCGPVEGMYTWVKGRIDNDPILAVVDDFAGTGNTLIKGIDRLWSKEQKLISSLADDGRIICCLQTAFPEAINKLKGRFPKLQVLAMKTFDDEVKAFARDAGIFEDEGEREYAQDVMQQIGRELVSQNPLGYGDMAALVSFHNTIPNNTLPVFWASGKVNGQEWKPLLPRGTWSS